MSILLVNGDALKIPLADGSVQMVITSPPYYNAREEYASWSNYPAYLEDMARVWAECYRVLCDGGRIAVNVPLGYGRPGMDGGYILVGDDTARAMVTTGFELRGHIIWHKSDLASGSTAWGSWRSASNPSLQDIHELIIVGHKGAAGRKRGVDTIDRDTFLAAVNSVWSIPPVSQHWHPATFPPEIPRRLIELYTFTGDIVLDPFSGSGTTAYTADRLGRHGVGVEYSSDYVRRSAITAALQAGHWDTARALKHRPTEITDLPMFAEVSA